MRRGCHLKYRIHGKEQGSILLRHRIIKKISGFSVHTIPDSYQKCALWRADSKKLRIRMPDSPDTCGRSRIRRKKVADSNNILQNICFSINGLKETAENLNYYPLCFCQLTVNGKVFFVASCKCCQQRLRSRCALFISKVLCLVNLLARTIFENICLPLFSVN